MPTRAAASRRLRRRRQGVDLRRRPLRRLRELNNDLVPGDTNVCGGDATPAWTCSSRDRVLGTTERVSVGPGGVQANGHSRFPVISDDGRFVAFASSGDQLLGPAATPTASRTSSCATAASRTAWRSRGCVPSTERVSVTDDEEQATGADVEPLRLDMSADGRFVAFDFRSTNLPFGFDGGDESGVYVRDRVAGTTEQVVRLGDAFASAPSISSDGRFVAYPVERGSAGAPSATSAVYDRTTGIVEIVNVRAGRLVAAGEASSEPSVSDDGRFVLFTSDSPDLLGPGRDTNGVADLFVRDRVLGMTERVSVGDRRRAGDRATAACSPARSRPTGRARLRERRAEISSSDDCNGVPTSSCASRSRAGGAPISSRTARSTTSCSRCCERPRRRGAPASPSRRSVPAGEVAAAFGKAAFLRPESPTGTAHCPGGSLNGDGDVARSGRAALAGRRPVAEPRPRRDGGRALGDARRGDRPRPGRATAVPT